MSDTPLMFPDGSAIFVSADGEVIDLGQAKDVKIITADACKTLPAPMIVAGDAITSFTVRMERAREKWESIVETLCAIRYEPPPAIEFYPRCRDRAFPHFQRRAKRRKFKPSHRRKS